MSPAATWVLMGTAIARSVEWFVAVSIALLCLQVLNFLENFVIMFPSCGPLARRWIRCRHICPFADAGSVLPVKTDVPNGKFEPLAFFAVGIVAVRSVNAIYIDERDLTCIA